MYDVICVGSSTVDVFACSKRADLITFKDCEKEKCMLAYPIGSKILIKKLNFTTGGGGTNCAVAFSRLGLKTAYLGKMGDDNNAQLVIKNLKKEKVDSLAILGKDNMTGYSIILDSIKHDRTILAYKGANNHLKWSEIKKNKLKTKWFYFSTLLETSFKTLEKLAIYARKNNIKVAFNVSEYLARKGPKYLAKILKNTEVFILNKVEAKLMTKKDNVNQMLEKLHSYGPKIVAITCGGNELFVSDGSIVYKAKPNNIKLVETTGAGDAFAASFVTGLIKNDKIKTAIELGIHNAQSVISHHGAKNKLLTWKEIQQMCKKKKVCIN